MSAPRDHVGFSQRVHLEWLEQAAALAMAGSDRTAANCALQELLSDKVSVGGTSERGNREKVITILLKVWLDVPPELESFRRRGLDLCGRLPQAERLAVHWGMVMAVYPFWADVAAQVGRLLGLQGSAAAAHVQRRLREQYGERETVSRATRRVLRSYIDWGVLGETRVRGVYGVASVQAIEDPELVAWLAEATLRASAAAAVPLNELASCRSLFPFRMRAIAPLIRSSPHLEVLRHGLDQDLVLLRTGSD